MIITAASSEVFCEGTTVKMRPKLDCIRKIGKIAIFVSTVVLLLEDSTGGYCRIRFSVSVVSGKFENSKNHQKT